MKTIRIFHLGIFKFLVIKFSVYLNRRFTGLYIILLFLLKNIDCGSIYLNRRVFVIQYMTIWHTKWCGYFDFIMFILPISLRKLAYTSI